MKNKRGFTLIELLGVIIIIGLIAIIAIPTVSRYLISSKNTAYSTYEKSMETAAKNRILNCIANNEQCDLPEGSEERRLFLDLLIDEGYLENMKDPDSDSFCSELTSYVSIKGNNSSNYNYQACLYCGDYSTDDAVCSKINGEGNPPVCGAISGASTIWTNQNRTISVGCSEETIGCTSSAFSKTFNTTTKTGNITIRTKNSSNSCPVNVYVDKTAPTCNITVDNDNYLESVGWYSLSATTRITNMSDGTDESGLLTYGMGTSFNNRDYNKKTSLTVNNGITTVFGYVKDNASNEGLCSAEVKVGTNIPVFDYYYGYQIFPSNRYTSNGMQVSGNSITTTSNNPTISFSNMSKYHNIEKVVVNLNSPIETSTTATIQLDSLSLTGLMQQGSSEIVFVLPSNASANFNNITIKLGELPNKTYSIDRIDVLTKNGSTWSYPDIQVYIEPIDAGMRTSEVSYDNGATWTTNFRKKYSDYAEISVKTRNSILMESSSTSLEIHVDKEIPTVTLKATKANTNIEIYSNSWSNTGLDFKLSYTTGQRQKKIYYCKDTTNSCNPNIEATNNQLITAYNTITTNYYLRYIIISETGAESLINSYIAKFDTFKPSCVITNHATLSCQEQGDNKSGIVGWYYSKENNSNGQYTIISGTNSFSTSANANVTSTGTYYLYVKDLAGNTSDVVSTNYYLVTYDKNGGTTDPSKTSEIVRAEQNADLLPEPTRTNYVFAGWNTDRNATTALTTYQVNSNVTLYAVWVNLWAQSVIFDDSHTNLGCTTVQCALDELSERF